MKENSTKNQNPSLHCQYPSLTSFALQKKDLPCSICYTKTWINILKPYRLTAGTSWPLSVPISHPPTAPPFQAYFILICVPSWFSLFQLICSTPLKRQKIATFVPCPLPNATGGVPPTEDGITVSGSGPVEWILYCEFTSAFYGGGTLGAHWGTGQYFTQCMVLMCVPN